MEENVLSATPKVELKKNQGKGKTLIDLGKISVLSAVHIVNE
jgi:hypothetical protein